jgi:hypothetical protein
MPDSNKTWEQPDERMRACSCGFFYDRVGYGAHLKDGSHEKQKGENKAK